MPPATDIASVFPTIDVTPIDLATALQMVDVRNPQFLLAQSRVLESVALRQLAAAQFLPNINAGTSYDGHTGNLQQSSGNILSVKRNSLTVGAGVYAVAAGTVNIPGILWNQNPSQVLFGYLTSRQGVAMSQFAAEAERNNIGLRVVEAYLDLLEAEGRRSIYLQSFREADELARITEAYARTGQGRPADANRAAAERLDRHGFVVITEGEALIASARLAQLLGLDPSLRLHPTDNWVVPHNLVPAPITLPELLTIALLRRPEMRERQAATRQALLALNSQRLLPFSPQIYLGFSADEFGGGSNLIAQPAGVGPYGAATPDSVRLPTAPISTRWPIGRCATWAWATAPDQRCRQPAAERRLAAVGGGRAGADGSGQRLRADAGSAGSNSDQRRSRGRGPRFVGRGHHSDSGQRGLADRSREQPADFCPVAFGLSGRDRGLQSGPVRAVRRSGPAAGGCAGARGRGARTTFAAATPGGGAGR